MAKELPRGRFVEIPRAVHTLHEDNPEAVLTALRDFLGFRGDSPVSLRELA
jgi:pimeloyl-ACP methyl ester carboxylesterase